MPKISIIVPVYNTEKYLHYCIDSILAQTFTDFELILINDGSKDNSGVICDEYAAKDSRVCVFHIENGGANAARKKGLEKANGEYVMFVDSDDWILENGIEKLFIIASENSMADIVVAHMNKCKVVSNFVFVMDLFNGQCSSNLWSKLYKRNIIKDKFCDIPKEYPMGEDLLQNVNFGLSYYGHVLYCNTEFYVYRRNCESISNTFVSTQTYENKFHAFVGHILEDKCLDSDIKLKIWINWQKSRINGYRQIILSDESMDYCDLNFKSMKASLKPYTQNLNVEDKLVLFITNKSICRFFLTVYYKIRRIYFIIRRRTLNRKIYL